MKNKLFEMDASFFGAAKSGKSALLNRFRPGGYKALEDYQATTGAPPVLSRNYDGGIKYLFKEIPVKTNDTARQWHASMSNIIILVFDINKKESFDYLSSLVKKIKSAAKEDAQYILVGTHTDLQQNVPDEKIKVFVKRNEMTYFPVSLATDKGFSELENHLLTIAKNQQKEMVKKELLKEIDDFNEELNPNGIDENINGISTLLKWNLEGKDNHTFELDKENLEEKVEELQFKKMSLYNSAINVCYVLFGTLIFGLIHFSFLYKNVYGTEKPSARKHYQLFPEFGEKQMAEALIEEVKEKWAPFQQK